MLPLAIHLTPVPVHSTRASPLAGSHVAMIISLGIMARSVFMLSFSGSVGMRGLGFGRFELRAVRAVFTCSPWWERQQVYDLVSAMSASSGLSSGDFFRDWRESASNVSESTGPLT